MAGGARVVAGMGRRWHGPPLQEALRGRGARLDDFNQMWVGSALALHVRGAGRRAHCPWCGWRTRFLAAASVWPAPWSDCVTLLARCVAPAQPKKDVHGSKMTRQE